MKTFAGWFRPKKWLQTSSVLLDEAKAWAADLIVVVLHECHELSNCPGAVFRSDLVWR